MLRVENDLSIFEFHDSRFSLVNYNGKDLIISVEYLNIHKNTTQNPSDFDMEIENAEITFKNINILTYEPGRVWKTDIDGNSYPIGPRIVYVNNDALNKTIEEFENKSNIYHFEKLENTNYSIGACGIEPYYEIEFNFDNVSVCWEKYKKKAWYEMHHTYQYDVQLQTPDGNETVTLTIHHNEEAEYYKHDENYPTVSALCSYNGVEYRGTGTDYLWIDALANLQKALPKDVILKCCVTCRHGNQCPFGDKPNEVFCTKDVNIHHKYDLDFYTTDYNERDKRSRQYCDVCEEYKSQSDNYYTYNDFLYHLK